MSQSGHRVIGKRMRRLLLQAGKVFHHRAENPSVICFLQESDQAQIISIQAVRIDAELFIKRRVLGNVLGG